jgi:hypothetical protein
MQLIVPSVKPPFVLLVYWHSLIGGKIGVAPSRSSAQFVAGTAQPGNWCSRRLFQD